MMTVVQMLRVPQRKASQPLRDAKPDWWWTVARVVMGVPRTVRGYLPVTYAEMHAAELVLPGRGRRRDRGVTYGRRLAMRLAARTAP